MTHMPTVVWTEIPVSDLAKGQAFYEAAFGWSMVLQTAETSGSPNDYVDFSDDLSRVGGHLYPGMPASGNGPTIHLAVPGTLEDGIARFTNAGGAVLSPPVEIPPGRFVYATDPDGNCIGLFEPKGA